MTTGYIPDLECGVEKANSRWRSRASTGEGTAALGGYRRVRKVKTEVNYRTLVPMPFPV